MATLTEWLPWKWLITKYPFPRKCWVTWLKTLEALSQVICQGSQLRPVTRYIKITILAEFLTWKTLHGFYLFWEFSPLCLVDHEWVCKNHVRHTEKTLTICLWFCIFCWMIIEHNVNKHARRKEVRVFSLVIPIYGTPFSQIGLCFVSQTKVFPILWFWQISANLLSVA